jgi:hypothetical protein
VRLRPAGAVVIVCLAVSDVVFIVTLLEGCAEGFRRQGKSALP